MGAQGGVSHSGSKSENQSNQRVWGPQGDALRGLFDEAQNLYNNSDFYRSNIDNMIGGMSRNLQDISSGAQGGYERMLSGGSIGNTEDIRNQLLQSINTSMTSPSNTQRMYESIVGGPGNEYIDPMVDAMKTGAMDNLNRMQSSVGLDAAALGQSGGSRHAMQNAMLAKEANKDMMAQEAMMRGGAYDKDLAMKMDIARMADTNVGAGQDRLMQMLSSADQNVGTGMGFGQSMQNLGMGALAPWMQGSNASWDMMDRYGNVIGRPTVLGSSSGSSKGASHGMQTSGGGAKG